MIDYPLTGIALLIIAVLIWQILKNVASAAVKIILNSAAGLLILLFLNTYLGLDIPLNWVTLLSCGLFGLPAVGTIIILSAFRIM